jgi:hypothetical protein
MKNKYSRISKNVNNCTAKIYFHTIQQELPLKWRSSMEAYWDRNHYVDSSSNTNFNPRNEFLTQLGIKAAFSLHSRGSESVDIPPNAENELFFDYIQGRRVLPHLIILSSSVYW